MRQINVYRAHLRSTCKFVVLAPKEEIDPHSTSLSGQGVVPIAWESLLM